MPGTAEYLRRWRKKHPGYHRKWMARSREKYTVPLEKGCKILGVAICSKWYEAIRRLA